MIGFTSYCLHNTLPTKTRFTKYQENSSKSGTLLLHRVSSRPNSQMVCFPQKRHVRGTRFDSKRSRDRERERGSSSSTSSVSSMVRDGVVLNGHPASVAGGNVHLRLFLCKALCLVFLETKMNLCDLYSCQST